jgi:uncharacterized protein (DUF927 family)
VFVLPDETLGDAKINIILDNVINKYRGGYGFRASGSREEWCERIAKPLAGNSNVVLAVGTFLAAPLLRWGDEPGGGFHFHGPAKVGKTLIGAIGQSVWGKPFAPGAGADAFGYTWESTSNRIGERAVLRSDVGLYLDEIGIGDQRAIATTVYKLAGGLDKGRYGQDEQDFNVLFVSTGELSLAEFLPNARQGQLVRMVDIPAVVQSESAFETIARDRRRWTAVLFGDEQPSWHSRARLAALSRCAWTKADQERVEAGSRGVVGTAASGEHRQPRPPAGSQRHQPLRSRCGDAEYGRRSEHHAVVG